MQEHPIPQDVTGYKFHIVGNMTLKQFAQVGAGVLVGVIFYNTNLLPIFKWPLVALSVGLGAMMAFVPIEERPLDHWIVTFFRRLYSPTKFYWRKESSIPFALKPEKIQVRPQEPVAEVDLTPARQKRIRDYIASVQQPSDAEPWEKEEASRVSGILETFDDVEVENVTSKPQAIKPQLTPRIRMLSAREPAQEVVFESMQETTEPIAPVESVVTPSAPPSPAAEAPLPPVAPLPVPPADPAEQTVAVFEEPIPEPAYTPAQTPATTNESLPFPEKSTVPNMIMGMVLTPDNKLVDRAVVTIRNTQGDTVAALNTNLLGQFFATAPLPNGTYNLSVKKEGLTFIDQELVLSGNPVLPLELRAS